MDKLEEFINYAICPAGIKECFYEDECTCAECMDRIFAEHDEKIRENTIDIFAEYVMYSYAPLHTKEQIIENFKEYRRYCICKAERLKEKKNG